MPASLVSLLCRPFRTVARRLPSRATNLAWRAENGVSVAVWTAPETDTGAVSCIRLEIERDDALRRSFVLRVSPDGYMTVSFAVADLETARSLALRQLSVARGLPAVRREPAAGAAPADPAPEANAFRPATDAMAERRDKAA